MRLPVLAFFPRALLVKMLPDGATAEARVRAEKGQAARDEERQQNIERVRAAASEPRIIELPDTHHWCFVQRLKEVVHDMRGFLAAHPVSCRRGKVRGVESTWQ